MCRRKRSEGQWPWTIRRLASATSLQHVAALARHLGAEIVDEHGVRSGPEHVTGFPFEPDIQFGLQQIAQTVQARGAAIVPGLRRPVEFDAAMVELVLGSEDPAARFEAVMRVVQDVDAHHAAQKILRSEDGQIVGAWQLTQGQATILPLGKPRVSPAAQEQLAGQSVGEWWLLPMGVDGDPVGPSSYRLLGRVPYAHFLRALPQGKAHKIDAASMLVEPLDREDLAALLT